MSDKKDEKDETSFSSEEERTLNSLWVTAGEIAGASGMPSTERRTRDVLKKLSKNNDNSTRRRFGTKAIEYRATILPSITLQELGYREVSKNKINNEIKSQSVARKIGDLLEAISSEMQEKIYNQIVENGVNSLIISEENRQARAITELLMSLKEEDMREILHYIQTKKLSSILKPSKKMA